MLIFSATVSHYQRLTAALNAEQLLPGIAANVTNAWRALTITAFGSTPALDSGTIIVGCCSSCCCVVGASEMQLEGMLVLGVILEGSFD